MSESVAVGSRRFVEEVQRRSGRRGRYRTIVEVGGAYVLRERNEEYARNAVAVIAA